MHRFFVETNSQRLVPGELLLLSDKLAHQVRDVLHLVVGEQLVLLDNSGDEIRCTVKSSTKAGVEVLVVGRQAGKTESPVRVILCQGLLKSARFEWILEKGTELGVSTFVPVLCRRSMAGLEDAGKAKIQRWQRILEEATEQCGRARRPALLPIRPLMQALSDIPTGAIALMAWEEEQSQSLHDVLQAISLVVSVPSNGSRKDIDSCHSPTGKVYAPNPNESSGNTLEAGLAQDQALRQPITVVLFIGPEGGLLKEEVQLAQQYGVQSVTLGTRILRAETAALAAVAMLMYELEARLKKIGSV
jgi:16S rRNA (uracil1498-N3)-methyltransferase